MLGIHISQQALHHRTEISWSKGSHDLVTTDLKLIKQGHLGRSVKLLLLYRVTLGLG